jgi:hypothetical protein
MDCEVPIGVFPFGLVFFCLEERSVSAPKEVKGVCKEFGLPAGILKGSIAKASKKAK